MAVGRDRDFGIHCRTNCAANLCCSVGQVGLAFN